MPAKKVYTREFKRETLRLLQSSGRSKADLEHDLGLYPGQIRMWQRALGRNEEHMDPAFPGPGHQSDPAAQLRALRRETASHGTYGAPRADRADPQRPAV
jgi:transposase